MKKESKYTKYLELIVLVALIFGAIMVSKQFDFVKNLKSDTPTEKYISIIGIIIMAFIVLGVHELGHLVVGLINGFRFELFVVGPLGIKREDDKVKVYLNKNLGYYGGVAATSPVDDSKENAKKFAKVLLAGPIASLLFAIVCYLIAYLIGKPLGILFYSGGLISIGIFLATTVPSSTGMFFTDRKRYQRLTTPGKDQEVELAMLKIIGKYSKDDSYKNVDKEYIDILVADEYPFVKFFGFFTLVCFQLENDGVVEEETSSAYESLSKKMSKSLVTAFNKEIDKLKDKLNMETS